MWKSLFFFNRKRILVFILAVGFVLAAFLVMFQNIELRLNTLSTRIIKEVALEKGKLVQKELEDFDRIMDLMGFCIDQNQPDLLPKLLGENDLQQLVVAYSFWENGPLQPKRTLNWYDPAYQADRNLLLGASYVQEEGTLLLNGSQASYLQVYHRSKSGMLELILDLNKLNDYFYFKDLGGRAYFELFNPEGICIMGPEIEKVGQERVGGLQPEQIHDSLLISDYILQRVFMEEFKLKGLFSKNRLLVSVPVSITEDEVRDIVHMSLLLGGIGIVIMLVFFYLIDVQNRQAKRLMLKNLEYQKEDALLRFENLKRKIDPHFLFNALGSLQQLIGKNPTQAKTFVAKMAKVYRKFLSQDHTGLATLKAEVELAEEYFFLQKIRFGDTLSPIEIDIQPATMSWRIPKFSLQVLIENAIKHNELNKEKPLSIAIFEREGKIYVRNTIFLKNPDVDSAGYGTQLIANVYDFYQVQGFEIEQNEIYYEVCLPLMQAEN